MKENSICGDNRFEIIEKAKEMLLNATNIEDSKEEMKVLTNILFRMWQVGLINEEKLEINKLQKYSLYKEEFSRLNQQLQSKDKIIDLMEEYISNITDCPFESEGKYLDCEKMCDVRTDKECWKQYFKNKAKEVKKWK